MRKNYQKLISRLMISFGSLLVTIGLVVGIYALSHWAKNAQKFDLDTITVLGNDLVAKEEIITISGLKRGSNIWLANLFESEGRLLVGKRFNSVVLNRKLPNKIVIHVNEKQPIALLQLDRLYGISQKAELIPMMPKNGLPDLPIISVDKAGFQRILNTINGGTPTFESLRDAILVSPDIIRALYLTRTIKQKSPLLYRELSEVHVLGDEETVVYMVDGGLAIRFGTGQYLRKLEMLEQTIAKLKVDSIKTTLIDLRFKDQVIVRPTKYGNSDQPKRRFL